MEPDRKPPKPWEPLLELLTTPLISRKGGYPTIDELQDFFDKGDLVNGLSRSERLVADLAIDLYSGRDCQINQLLARLDTEGILALLLVIGAARWDVAAELQRRAEKIEKAARSRISVVII